MAELRFTCDACFSDGVPGVSFQSRLQPLPLKYDGLPLPQSSAILVKVGCSALQLGGEKSAAMAEINR